MPFDFGGLMQGAATSAIGAGMGLLLEHHEDTRQLNQQQKLQDMQIAGQKQMVDYNQAAAFKMWQDTNYPAQVEQLEKAGMNPALLYGKGGGGGTTIGNPSGSVSGAEAPKGGQEIPQQEGMALQLQLLQAQKENIKADTVNKLEDAKNKAADTQNKPLQGENIQASTASLKQGIQNAQAQQAYTEAETALANIQVDIQGSEINDLKAAIKYGMRELYAKMQSSQITANVDQQTQQSKIRLAQLNVAQATLQTYLTKAQTANVNQQTSESVQKVNNMIQENMREWDKMSQKDQEIAIQKMLADYSTEIPPEVKTLLDNIFIIPHLPTGNQRPPVGFKIK